MRRILLLLAAVAAFATASATPAAAAATLHAPAAPVSAALAAPGCVSSAAATYRHTFDGAHGTVTITAATPLCAGQTQSFALASYTASNSGRFVYDRAAGTITSTNRSLTLNVDVPSCATEVIAMRGRSAPTEITGSVADPLARYAGGSGECAPQAQVTFTNACDGTFTARLTNPAGARTPAVFLTGTRLIRVAPGRSTSLDAAAGSTLTIRANTFTTYVGTWRTPAAGCDSAAPTTAPTTAAAAPAPPAVTTPPAASPGSTSAPVADTDPATTPGAMFSTSPAAVATAASSSTTGMGTGSVLAIGIGLVMIGAGGIALAYLIREIRKPA
ncbi:MAG: hypothetical protein ABW046_18910 [Actinoplanes sp.]